MDADPRLLAQLASRLAAVCPPEQLNVAAAETFDGATPFSDLPTAIISFRGAADPLRLAELAGSRASAELGAILGLDFCWGADESDGLVRCWLECLHPMPALQALALSLLAAAAEAGGSGAQS